MKEIIVTTWQELADFIATMKDEDRLGKIDLMITVQGEDNDFYDDIHISALLCRAEDGYVGAVQYDGECGTNLNMDIQDIKALR